MKYFTKKWYKNCQMTLLSKKKKLEVQCAIDDYETYYRQIESQLPDNIKRVNTDYMHDCIVLGSYFIGHNFHIDLDSEGAAYSTEKVELVNAEIAEGNTHLNGAHWIYDEIYIQKDRYELHILFWHRKRGLEEIVVQFDDVIIT